MRCPAAMCRRRTNGRSQQQLISQKWEDMAAKAATPRISSGSDFDDFGHFALARLFPRVLRQQPLTQPDRRWRRLDQLVLLDVLQRLLERHLPRRLEDDVL